MMPTICGRCGASLTKAPVRQERWDVTDRVWAGFVDCPACGTVYVVVRKGPPPVNGHA